MPNENLNYVAKGFNTDLAIRWGFFKEELEIIGELQYQKDTYNQLGIATDRSALKQTILGAKYLFYDPTWKKLTNCACSVFTTNKGRRPTCCTGTKKKVFFSKIKCLFHEKAENCITLL